MPLTTLAEPTSSCVLAVIVPATSEVLATMFAILAEPASIRPTTLAEPALNCALAVSVVAKELPVVYEVTPVIELFEFILLIVAFFAMVILLLNATSPFREVLFATNSPVPAPKMFTFAILAVLVTTKPTPEEFVAKICPCTVSAFCMVALDPVPATDSVPCTTALLATCKPIPDDCTNNVPASFV